jgi:hypothetical protein
VLPWPLRGRPKGLGCFREYQKAGYFESSIEAHLFLSEFSNAAIRTEAFRCNHH